MWEFIFSAYIIHLAGWKVSKTRYLWRICRTVRCGWIIPI